MALTHVKQWQRPMLTMLHSRRSNNSLSCASVHLQPVSASHCEHLPSLKFASTPLSNHLVSPLPVSASQKSSPAQKHVARVLSLISLGLKGPHPGTIRVRPASYGGFLEQFSNSTTLPCCFAKLACPLSIGSPFFSASAQPWFADRTPRRGPTCQNSSPQSFPRLSGS